MLMHLVHKLRSFHRNRAQKRLARALETVRNRKAGDDARRFAIELLMRVEDAAVAVPGLLQRFDMSLEHGMNDAREKEACLDGILRHGAEALPYLLDHLKATSRIAWPLKALKELADPETIGRVLLELLDDDEDVAFDQAKVDKNYDVLCALVDYRPERLVERVAPFLGDHDERVRFAAMELLLAQDDPAVPPIVEPFGHDESPENTRLRRAVTSRFQDRLEA